MQGFSSPLPDSNRRPPPYHGGGSSVFCGINPGFRSSEAGTHFANPRNDFWRLLADADLTPRRLVPEEQWTMLDLGYGLTNAAHRTTKGSSDLRRGDFAGSAERLERLAEELRPGILAFVGKAGYEGAFREKPALGLQAAPPRGDEGFRAPVDLASERGGFLRGAAALVSQSA